MSGDAVSSTFTRDPARFTSDVYPVYVADDVDAVMWVDDNGNWVVTSASDYTSSTYTALETGITAFRNIFFQGVFPQDLRRARMILHKRGMMDLHQSLSPLASF